MLLSDFSQSDLQEATGIEVDAADYFPRADVRSISFTAKLDEAGDRLDQDLLDTIIAYKTSGIAVTLDLPASVEIDPSSLLSLLQPLDIPLCLMAPQDESNLSRYVDRLEAFACALPEHSGYGNAVLPVTTALFVLIRQRLQGSTGYPMVADAATAEIRSSHLNSFLAAVQRGFEKALGGEKAFGEYLDIHIAAIHEDSRRKLAAWVHNQSDMAETPQP